jgi:hypothetical protein
MYLKAAVGGAFLLWFGFNRWLKIIQVPTWVMRLWFFSYCPIAPLIWIMVAVWYRKAVVWAVRNPSHFGECMYSLWWRFKVFNFTLQYLPYNNILSVIAFNIGLYLLIGPVIYAIFGFFSVGK